MSPSPTFPEPSSLSPLQALVQVSPPTSVRDPQGACRRELLAALQRQDDLAIARLSARWAHRYGVVSLQGLIRQLEGAAVSTADQSDGEPPFFDPAAPIHPSRFGDPIGQVDQADVPSPPGLPPAELPASQAGGNVGATRFNPIRRLKSLVRDCIDEVASTFQDGDGAFAAEQQQPAPLPLTLAEPADPTPRPVAAPVPLDLADLRSWLPDRQDDQHRRAS